MGKGGGLSRRIVYSDPQKLDIYVRKFAKRFNHTTEMLRILPRIEILHDLRGYQKEVESLVKLMEDVCYHNDHSSLLTPPEAKELDELTS